VSGFRELLRRCSRIGEEQAAFLERHYELMCRWNRVLNLTRVEALEEAVERHYCESLFLSERLPATAGERVADVGSGAGFPGIPLAVARPELAVTLIESHQRKAVFLQEATRGFGNVRVVARRAEDVGKGFDWVVSRAVSYRDLEAAAERFGARWALLGGVEEPPTEWGASWDAIALPWGKQRYLRISREPIGVSRET
jgi:16S rRNA (guanine(527)-N(7))-methyltransferase RsmG